jgi:hypothetical protein
MKFMWLILALFGLAAQVVSADDASALKALEARYDTSKFATDEKLREKYINELAVLRFQFVRDKSDAWKLVDAEIEKYPAPANSDSAALTKLRDGKWESSRHDYLYKADGTWFMDPDDKDTPLSEHTNGTWSISGNKYTDDAGTFTIILLDEKAFIYTITSDDTAQLYYERRAGSKVFPLRRDELGE